MANLLVASTVVELAILVSVKAVLGLCHSVATVGVLVPGLLGVSSSLGVEGSVVLENTGLLRVSLVVGFLLLGVSGTNFLVFCLAHALRDVRALGELGSLELKYSRVPV